jgi:hypothetical protein
MHGILPYNAAAKDVVLLNGSTELDRMAVSNSAPTVQVVSPNGGGTLTEPWTVQWSSNDPDGDPLRYTVQYSADGGTEWINVATGVHGTQATITDAIAPGSAAARVRVIATDGYHAAMDTSDGNFTLSGHLPYAHITTPQEGDSYGVDEQVLLSGRGFDTEDLTVAPSGLQWLVDGNPAGTGREVLVSGLAPGLHEATLTATDANGGIAVAFARFVVGDCNLPGGSSSHVCFLTSGLWHTETGADVSGMTSPMLAFNQGCTGSGITGCNYNTGSAVTGTAASVQFGPVTGGLLAFRTARQTESGCGSFDRTIVKYSTDGGATYLPLPLTGGQIDPGGQTFGGTTGHICGNSTTAQDVLVPLPDNTTNVAFEFDSVDNALNNFAGWFIDDVAVICQDDADSDNICGATDLCPGWNPSAGDLDSDGTPDDCDADDDGDGCSDIKESGSNHNLGGRRDFLYYWDFYDVTGNGTIDLSDTLLILQHFGHGPNGDALDNKLDRVTPYPTQLWRSAESNSGVDLQDALANLRSFGHSC